MGYETDTKPNKPRDSRGFTYSEPGNARSDDLGGYRQGGGGEVLKLTAVTTQNSSKPSAGGVYLESIVNVSFEAKSVLHKLSEAMSVVPWLSCACDKSQWFVPAEDAAGHRFSKEIICGKEWCPRCGEDDSVAHNRRFARWLKKIQQMESVGYFVFTIPEDLRSKFRTREELARLGKQVQELLKAHGHVRGLRRWHFFGDKSTAWHPHLNVLVDGGFVSPEQLEGIKAEYAGILKADLAVVNYRYKGKPGKMVHTLKYVARATFRDYRWSPELAMELRGFRNMVSWGRGLWDNDPVWSLQDLKGKARASVEDLDVPAIESLAAKKCPDCGLPLKWDKPLPMGLLRMVEHQSLGAGYYRLAARPPPEEHVDIQHLKHVAYWRHLIREIAREGPLPVGHGRRCTR